MGLDGQKDPAKRHPASNYMSAPIIKSTMPAVRFLFSFSCGQIVLNHSSADAATQLES